MIYQLLKRQDDRDIPRILSAYKLPSVSQYISIDKTNYWQYVTTSANVCFYKIFLDDILVATSHCEVANRILYMDVVVFPEYQRRGIAARILTDIQEGKLGLDYDKIWVSIDEKNTASISLFENAAFVCVGRDEELLEYEYTKS